MAIDTEQRAPASPQNGDSPEENLTGRGTYKTLDEQQGRLSPAEERFERQRRTIGLFLGPIVLGAMLLIPFDLDGNQHRLAAILAFVVVWWVTEAIPIPMTALLGVVLCALLEATPPPPEGDSSVDVVFGLFTDDTVMLFIGSFIIAQAMVVHGLHRRLAYRVLSLSWVGGNTYRIILAFGLIGAITSPVMSNTAGAAMMLPIGLGVMGVVGGMVANQARGEQRVERLRFGAALMLVITYGITVGGLLLPIGSPPNLIGRELLEAETGEPITFFEWFLMALPIVLVMFVAVIVIVLALNRPEVKEVEGVEEYVREERGKLGRLSRGEKNTLLVLAFALIGWFLPGLVGHRGRRRLERLHPGPGGRERGHRRDPGGDAAVRAAGRLEEAQVHAQLEPGQPDRLGNRDPVRRRPGARLPAEPDRARGGRGQLAVRLARGVEPVRHHGRHRDRGRAGVRDHQQHRQRSDHGADRDLDRRRL